MHRGSQTRPQLLLQWADGWRNPAPHAWMNCCPPTVKHWGAEIFYHKLLTWKERAGSCSVSWPHNQGDCPATCGSPSWSTDCSHMLPWDPVACHHRYANVCVNRNDWFHWKASLSEYKSDVISFLLKHAGQWLALDHQGWDPQTTNNLQHLCLWHCVTRCSCLQRWVQLWLFLSLKKLVLALTSQGLSTIIRRCFEPAAPHECPHKPSKQWKQRLTKVI